MQKFHRVRELPGPAQRHRSVIRLHLPRRDQHDYDSPEEEAAWEPYAAALRALPVPARTRDFSLSPEMARRLRPSGAWVQPRFRPRRTVLAPLAAVLIIALVLPRMMPTATSAPGGTAAPAAPGQTSLSLDNGQGAAPALINVTTNSACGSAFDAAITPPAGTISPSPTPINPLTARTSVESTAAPAPMNPCSPPAGGH